MLENKELYPLLFEFAPLGTAVTTPAATFLHANRAFCELLGYSAAELVGQPFTALLHPDDLAPYTTLEQQLLNDDLPAFHLETRCLAKDQRLIYLILHVSLVRDGAHQPLYFVAQLTDITARKQAEASLHRQNRELALLNRATQAFISSLDLNQVLIKVLEEVRDLLDVSGASAWLVDPVTDELVCWQATVPEHKIIQGWRLAPAQGIVGWVVNHRQSVLVSDTRQEARHFKGFDQALKVEIRSILAVPLFDQQEVFGVLELVDTRVDRFKRSDLELVELLATTAAIAIENASLFEALLDSEKRYRNLFENAAIALWEQDISALRSYLEELRQRDVRDFRGYFRQHPEAVQECLELVQVINVNRAALEMYRITDKADLLGQLNNNLFKADPVDLFTDQLVALAEGQTRFASEAVLSTLTGNKIYTDLSWSVAPTYSNLAQKVIVCLRDVTEQKRLQQQFLQAQKMEAVGQLAGGIAHNFNNMLTAIMGYLGLAIEALPPDHPIVADLQQVQNTAQRAASLTQQLLVFSRRQLIDPKPLNLNELILAIKPLLHPLLQADIELIVSLDPALRLVKIDATQFEQVLMNLALNARDAMPQGGQLIFKTTNVTLAQPNSNLEAEIMPGDYSLVSVTDTGMGMADETKAHLFEPFFTTKEIGKGTGLGLATCYGIIKQSKGHILVESQLGQGTTFNIYLPSHTPIPSPLVP